MPFRDLWSGAVLAQGASWSLERGREDLADNWSHLALEARLWNSGFFDFLVFSNFVACPIKKGPSQREINTAFG